MSDLSFSANLDHLHLHFQRIDLALQTYSTSHISPSDAENSFPGLVIHKKEFDRLFGSSDSVKEEKKSEFDELKKCYNDLCLKIDEFETANHTQTSPLRLITVIRKFGLNEIERDILLLSLAPEIDKKYEKILGYIQDDITMKLPCVDLALSLFSRNSLEKLRVRSIFNNSAPLLFHKIIELENDPSRFTPFPAQFLRVNRGITAFLLENDSMDPILEKNVKRIVPRAKISDLVLSDGVIDTIDSLSKVSPFSKVIYLQGNSGTGKKTIGEALCGIWNLNLLYLKNIPSATIDINLFTQLLCREAVLFRGVILVHDIEAAEDKADSLLRLLISWAGRYDIPLILCGKNEWEPGNLLPIQNFMPISIPFPSSSERQIMWHNRLNGYAPPDRDKVIQQIASTFKINGNQINDAVTTAMRNAFIRNPENVSITASDLFYGCRVHSSKFLSRNARKVASRYRWGNIVLPDEKIEQLKELCSNLRYQSVVFNNWGYDEKLSLGKGVHALFAGPSGTGKTMAAEIIAAELGIELYKIDLASVVSKYIGETEKNLSQIFDEAEGSNIILFFDEADALMGKRSEVKDAHDRYANIEISYLLQRMEEFSGMSLLATNFRKNIDDAFIRRIRYIIEFPFPDQTYRKKIWMGIWPPRAPLSADIDFEFLSYQFELSGGNIRNIALNASFIAAGKNQSINMIHILSATKREFQKMGKVFLNENFGRYRDLILQTHDQMEMV